MNTLKVPHIRVVDDDSLITEMARPYFGEHDFKIMRRVQRHQMHQVLRQYTVYRPDGFVPQGRVA